jgi:hypothetical protein
MRSILAVAISFIATVAWGKAAVELGPPRSIPPSGMIDLPSSMKGTPKVIIYRPRHIEGTLKIGSKSYHYGSGGRAGWSIPYGDYPITPGAIGNWGRHHGAVGLNNNSIFDDQLKRDREGIELHATGHFSSAGCVVVLRKVFNEVKKTIFALIETAGHAFLHVTPEGAEITSEAIASSGKVIYVASKVEHDRAHHKHRREAKHQHYKVHYSHHHRMAVSRLVW